MQGIDIELGGFKGRTNKLVDGCYSWWVGGCVALVEGFLGIGKVEKEGGAEGKGGDEDHEWDDVDGEIIPTFIIVPTRDLSIILQIRYSTARHCRSTYLSQDNTAQVG